MGSKVYEASTLKAATSERAHHYEQLREQFETLKKEFSKIVENHDFKGHGADAIKGFYQGQMDVIDAWIRLIDTNVGFFKGIPGDTEDVDLSGDTFVQVPFLEENVERAGKQAKDMVANQQEALQHIFNRVNDLVSLSVFSKDAFEDQMDKAEKRRSDTVEKVNEFDQRLSEEYSISQNQEQHIYGLFAQLMEATRQGETISPLNFNAEAYHNSEVYKAIGQAKKDTSDYLTFKKQQKEDRRIAKEIEEMENRPFYEKAWDTVCTFTGEVTGYYDTQRAATGVDPVTGRKLSDAERVTSGAMAAAGFVPFVGWAGRIGKGGSAVYKTVKGANTANHMLDAHRTAQGLKNLQKAEYGIYGLVSANGFGEYFTGKDMFGNELTEEQRNQSLFNAFAIVGVSGAGYGLSKVDMGEFVQTKLPYSTQYARQKLLQAEEILKTVKKNIGNTRVPVGFELRMFATNIGLNEFGFKAEMKSIKELLEQRAVKKEKGKEIKDTNLNVEVPPAFRQTEFASSYDSRINQTPAPFNPKIIFEGIRGESLSKLKPPPDLKLKKILDEAGINGIQYKNGVPDFSPVSKAQIEINYMLGGKGDFGGKARRANFAQSDQQLADKLNSSPELARQFGMESGNIRIRDIKKYREENKLTWHELNDVKTMQLVPTIINAEFGHLGGVGEINAGAFKPGGFANRYKEELVR